MYCDREKTTTITIRVPVKLRAWFEQELLIKEMSMTALIKGILEDYQKQRVGG